MRRSTIAFVSLILTTAYGCSGVPVVPSQPQVIEVVKPAPVLAACRRLHAVELPSGSTAQDVIEAQHRALVAYEEQVRECAR